LLLVQAQLTEVEDKENGPIPDAYRKWVKLVTDYSKGALTHQSDRLIAFYGVAQWMQKQLFHDEYLAGHWKKHLVNQLLWMTYKHLKKSRPAEYRAPSWSWASVNGAVAFRDILEADEYNTLAQVVDANVTTHAEKIGRVTGGYVEIRGKLLPATWKASSHKPSSQKHAVEDSGPAIADISSSGHEWDLNSTEDFQFVHGDEELQPWGISGLPDVEDDGFRSGESFCLAIQSREPPRDLPNKNFSLLTEGLVLKRDEKETGKFKRIGWFLAHDDGVRAFNRMSNSIEERIITII
jgi:hypothetical protein